MKVDEFVEKFGEQFDETDSKLFCNETKFREIEEWSSLMALAIIAMVDEEFKVKIKGDDIRNSQTIEDLFVLVSSKML